MKRSSISPSTRQAPRRVVLDEGTLVLPPVGLNDLPLDATVGTFKGVLALRYMTPIGLVAVFLHDLERDDLDAVLRAQRRQAEVQIGEGYARRAMWWEGVL